MHKWRGKIEDIPSKVSPRPWNITPHYYNEQDIKSIVDKNGNDVLDDFEVTDLSSYDAKHIIECVNSYEPAIREIERLQDIITKLMVNRDFEDFDKEVTNND